MVQHAVAVEQLDEAVSERNVEKAWLYREQELQARENLQVVREKLEIKPGGLHIMLTGLKRPLKAGDQFLLTLTFRKAGPIETTVAVQASAKGSGKTDHMPDMPGMKM